DIAVAQARGLLDRALLVDRERRGLGDGQALGLADLDLDVAGGQVGVLVRGLALDDGAARGEDVLGAQPLGHREGLGRIGVEDELDEPAAVAQVDEDQVAVVAAAVDPAGEADVALRVAAAQVAAPGVAVGVRARRSFHRPGPRSTSRTTSSRATRRWSPDSMSRSCTPPSSIQAT